MADHGPVKIREGQLDVLIKLYTSSYARIVQEIATSTSAGKVQRARVMARINVELESLGVDLTKWANANIPQYYLDGANIAIQDLRALGIDVAKTGNLALINREAIKALTDEVALAFAQSMTAISRNARNLLGDALKQQINFIIADGKLTGATRKAISNNVVAAMENQGLSALQDRGGRNWDFDTYARMLVRTKAVEARNQGLTNRMLQIGYDLVQVTRHQSTHQACAALEGKVLSLTGRTPKGTKLAGGFTVWGTLDEAKAVGLFHPNCKHAINVLIPSLAAKTEAYDPVTGKYAGTQPEVVISQLGGKRSENTAQKAMENALNAGDKVKAQQIVDKIQDPDLKQGLQSTLDALTGKKRSFRIDPVTHKIIPLP
jgi:hypothetical protein